MKQTLVDRFTEIVVSEAALRYGVERKKLNHLGHNQNFVYEFSHKGSKYILRITHQAHRSQKSIQGELDWINYLSANGVLVSVPVCSDNGLFIESFISGIDCFFFVAFKKAVGASWTDTISQNEEFRRLGTVVGRMHALAKEYSPNSLKTCRYNWNHNEYLRYFTRNVPPSHERVIPNFMKLMQKVSALPRGFDSYGLIHGDFCFGNYSVQKDGTVTVFDFDECQYGWFVQDIAVNLFYGIAVPSSGEDAISFTRRYLHFFLEGYDQENILDHGLLEQLPIFLDLRQAVLYSSLYRNGNVDSLDTWSQNFLKRARRNMENALPLVDIKNGDWALF